jgi:hypothetical protein
MHLHHPSSPVAIAFARADLIRESMALWRAIGLDDTEQLVAALARFDDAATEYARCKCIDALEEVGR